MIEMKTELTRLNQQLLELLPPLKRCWVAGGAGRNIFFEEDFNADVDVFFEDIDTCDLWKNHLSKYPEKKASYAITFELPYGLKTIDVQLVEFKLFPHIEDLFDDFDFTVCMFAYREGLLYTMPQAIKDVASNKVVINKVKSGVGTFHRLQKYENKGFEVSDSLIRTFLGTIVKNPYLIDKNYIGKPF